MKRVLCISDSLGLPRPKVKYEDTWFYKIGKEIPNMEFVSYFRRNGTTNMLSCNGSYDDTLLNYSPQIVILQLGICDCAPRYIRTTSLLYKILSRVSSPVSAPLWWFIKKVKKRSLKCTDVNVTQFKTNLINYIDKCRVNGVERMILIKIAIPGDSMVRANPVVLDSIALYNDVYDQLSTIYSDYVKVIGPISQRDNSLFTEDGYHTNGKGHDMILKGLINVL